MNVKLELKSLKVLVADDSRLVCSSIMVILREIGFLSSNIICAYKPIDVINHCKNYNFDVVVCDYNFNSKLNGYQLLDELRHMQLLSSHTFFIFLTGENQPKVVRSIIESEPDDYLLKPFNKPFFSSRLYAGLQRKQALASIYAAMHRQDYQLAVDECEQLEPFLPKYTLTIGALKARSLTAIKRYDEAIDEYERLLAIYNSDLLKVRLANALIEKGDREKARVVLATLESQDNNPYYHDEMALMSIQSGDLVDAIAHLKKATLLMEVGAERELIISNLSLALENYEDAFNYIKRYAEKNESTYRDNEHIQLNYVRCFLYRFNHTGLLSHFENNISLITPKVNALSKQPEVGFQYALLNVHIHLIRNELRLANSALMALNPPSDLHFYDYFHYVYLLDKLGLSKEVNGMLNNLLGSIRQEQLLHIKRSQQHMASSFKQLYYNKQYQIKGIKAKIERMNRDQEKDGNAYLELYIQLKELMPFSLKVNLAIIKLIANNSIVLEDNSYVVNVLADSNRVIAAQLTNDEQVKMNYKETYTKALQKIA